jgi:hypothetical protein
VDNQSLGDSILNPRMSSAMLGINELARRSELNGIRCGNNITQLIIAYSVREAVLMLLEMSETT